MFNLNVPPYAEWTEAAKCRQCLLLNNLPVIQNLAWQTLNVYGKQNDEFVIACIEVHPDWRELVDLFMSDYDWDSVQDIVDKQAIIVAAEGSFGTVVADLFPSLKQLIYDIPQSGKFKVIVIAEGGCTIYTVESKAMNLN